MFACPSLRYDICLKLSLLFSLSRRDRTQIKTHNSRRLLYFALRIIWYTFFFSLNQKSTIYGDRGERGKETKRRRQEEVKIKCVISFRQSASNRRDLELNSLLPTRYTTLFTTIITYKYIQSCRLKRKKMSFMLHISCIVLNIFFFFFSRIYVYVQVLEIHWASKKNNNNRFKNRIGVFFWSNETNMLVVEFLNFQFIITQHKIMFSAERKTWLFCSLNRVTVWSLSHNDDRFVYTISNGFDLIFYSAEARIVVFVAASSMRKNQSFAVFRIRIS